MGKRSKQLGEVLDESILNESENMSRGSKIGAALGSIILPIPYIGDMIGRCIGRTSKSSSSINNFN